jgi:CRISPR-associated protein Cas5 subtype I-C
MSFGIKLHVWGGFACDTRPEMKAERVSYDVITPAAARGILEAIYWKPQIRGSVERIHVLNPIRFTSIRRNEVGSKMTAPTNEFMSDGKQTALCPKHAKKKISGKITRVLLTPGQRVAKGQAILRVEVKNKQIVLESNSSGQVNRVLKSQEDLISTGEPLFEFIPDIGIEVDNSEVRQQRASLILSNVAYVIEARIDLVDASEPIGKHLDMFKRRARRGQYFHHPYFGTREFPASFALIESDSEIPPTHSDFSGEKELGFMLHDIEFDQDPRTKKVKSTTPRFFRAEMKDGIINVPPFHQSIA